jgi:hypothetical protein
MLACGAFAEETLESVTKATDMTNADSVFALAEWCASHGKPTTARQFYGKVIELDRDHEAARARLGQVKVGDRWVSAASAGPQAAAGKNGAAPGGANRTASGSGPAAKDVAWDLKIPEGSGDATFVDAQIERMNRAKNDSDDMDSAVLTLLRDDCRAQLPSRLATALLRPDFGDLYGPCQIILKLLKDKRRATARQILPFLAKCSEHVTDAEDLETFAYIGPMLRDRRLVARLMELMDHPNEAVKSAATKGAAQLTLLPAEGLTAARVKAWWDLNWNVPEHQVLAEQLHNPDPKISVEAAKGLYELRDKSIVPVLVKLLKADNKEVNGEAISVINRITGNSWDYEPGLPPEKKAKIAGDIEKWWKENQTRFEWIEDRNAKPVDEAKPKNPLAEWVQQLASVEGRQAEQAESNLRAKGKDAVPVLIGGLRDRSMIVRRKCNDLLKGISKQDFSYDPRADEDKLGKAIEAWRKWATSQKIALDAGEEGGDEAPTK